MLKYIYASKCRGPTFFFKYKDYLKKSCPNSSQRSLTKSIPINTKIFILDSDMGWWVQNKLYWIKEKKSFVWGGVIFSLKWAYQKSLKLAFEPVFLQQNNLLNMLVCIVNFKGYFVIKIVLNASFKAHWYSKDILLIHFENFFYRSYCTLNYFQNIVKNFLFYIYLSIQISYLCFLYPV